MFGGYLNDPDATSAGTCHSTQFQFSCFASTKVPILTQNARAAFTDDGYYKIGDVVRVTRVEDGAMAGRHKIVVLGRAKTSLKLANGLWVFCEALEVPPLYVCVCALFKYVCKYECLFVCMYVCMYVFMYVYTNVCMYIFMYIWMHGCMDVYMYIYM